jgi:hypothetical protein
VAGVGVLHLGRPDSGQGAADMHKINQLIGETVETITGQKASRALDMRNANRS